MSTFTGLSFRHCRLKQHLLIVVLRPSHFVCLKVKPLKLLDWPSTVVYGVNLGIWNIKILKPLKYLALLQEEQGMSFKADIHHLEKKKKTRVQIYTDKGDGGGQFSSSFDGASMEETSKYL